MIQIVGLKKSFGSILANQNVHLKVLPGTIHALIGENGAGKSTAMKQLFGMYRPDEGRIYIKGKEVSFRSPAEAMRNGIGMVHQHFMLAGSYTALDNLLLNHDRGVKKFFPLSIQSEKLRFKKFADELGFKMDWGKNVEELPVGTQQRLEILKLLKMNAEILIFDEPTAVLTPQEVIEFFDQLKKLKAQGKTIILITHKLKEVMGVSDEVTVFRNGATVFTSVTAKTNSDELAFQMIGKRIESHSNLILSNRIEDPAFLLEVNGLASSVLKGLSFSLKNGEILGVAGVSGNGQSELIEALYQPQEAKRHASLMGSVKFLGNEILGKSPKSTREIKKMGMAVIPEDRHQQAIFLDSSIEENFALGLHRRNPISFKGLLSRFFIQERLRQAIEAFSIQVKDTQALIRNLSGGNQQKVVIARELESSPKFLIAAQPTRGVDIGAIELIHRKIIEARNAGMGVLLVSTELDEILHLSDRILVMFEGAIVAEFVRGQVDERALGLSMSGAQAV